MAWRGVVMVVEADSFGISRLHGGMVAALPLWLGLISRLDYTRIHQALLSLSSIADPPVIPRVFFLFPRTVPGQTC